MIVSSPRACDRAAMPQVPLAVQVTRIHARARRGQIEMAIATARQRVARESPFSPSWDAAMADLEDLEGALLAELARIIR
jgi:hypothetical protein